MKLKRRRWRIKSPRAATLTFFQPASGLRRQAEARAPDEVREIDRAVDEEREAVEEAEDKTAVVQRRARSWNAPSLRVSTSREMGVSSRPLVMQRISPCILRAATSHRSGGRVARIDPSRVRGPPSASRDFESQLRSSKGGGRPLPDGTRVAMESSFGADFSGVRVHDGAVANRMSRGIEARAFTHGQDIYFARNLYQPENHEGRHLLAHKLTHVIQQGGGIREGVRRSTEISLAPPSLQRIPASMDEVRQEINGLAENIPGYALGTVLIGYNPILGQNVAWSASAFFRGAAGLIPGGVAFHDKLNEGGAIDDAFAWIEAQIAARNLTWGRVSSLWDTAWDRMGVTEGISGNLAIFRDVFSGFFGDVLGFIDDCTAKLTEILTSLAVSAVRTLFGSDGPAYDLMTMVLGKDPITDEARKWVTIDFLRAAMTFFGFQNHLAKMEETGQLQNAADWLDTQFGILSGAIGGLVDGVKAIWKTFSLATLADPLPLLQRIVRVVVSFIARMLELVRSVALKVLELINAALIALLKPHLGSIPGYPLLRVALGKDPITGEDVPRTAGNFIMGLPGCSAESANALQVKLQRPPLFSAVLKEDMVEALPSRSSPSFTRPDQAPALPAQIGMLSP